MELTFGFLSTTAVRYIESARKALLKWAQDLMAWPSETERRENGIQLRDGRLITMVVDCSEQPVVVSTNDEAEDACFSMKAHDHTFSVLVGCSPKNGKFYVKSKSYTGKTTDQEIFNDIYSALRRMNTSWQTRDFQARESSRKATRVLKY